MLLGWCWQAFHPWAAKMLLPPGWNGILWRNILRASWVCKGKQHDVTPHIPTPHPNILGPSYWCESKALKYWHLGRMRWWILVKCLYNLEAVKLADSRGQVQASGLWGTKKNLKCPEYLLLKAPRLFTPVGWVQTWKNGSLCDWRNSPHFLKFQCPSPLL